MSSSAPSTAYTPYDPGRTPVTGGWVSPLLSSLVTLPTAFFLTVLAMMSPMACDSCDSAQSRHFDASFEPAFAVHLCGLGLSMALLVTGWVLPRQQRFAAFRWVAAVLAPVVVLVGYAVFHELVDWP